ncbi:putative transposase [Burkholderia thailandensis USAMRU Malaysia |nr:putative transposase [Burkholderia thailandensis E444]AIC90911.1 putative transposase [Burkholderia thailandensis USAMRU Malaysia \
MPKQRRTFSPEFKQQASCLVLDQGYSHMEASRSVIPPKNRCDQK